MPCDYRNYPRNWKTEIRPAVLARAGQVVRGRTVVSRARCEQCGAEDRACGYRDKQGRWYDILEITETLEQTGQDLFDGDGPLSHCWDGYGKPSRHTRIVLTISHTDHDTKNNDMGNLRALCQNCAPCARPCAAHCEREGDEAAQVWADAIVLSDEKNRKRLAARSPETWPGLQVFVPSDNQGGPA